MMLVRNYVGKSSIDGFGVFAGEFIPKGTMVWEFTEGCDQVYSDELLAALLPVQREVILHYGYVEPGMEGVVLCCDNARHFNYALDPNCGPGGEMKAGTISTFAMRDIQPRRGTHLLRRRRCRRASQAWPGRRSSNCPR